MEELVVNISDSIVVIPTAGYGSRLGEITKHLNKALLPYNGKPLLSHIIDNFPSNTRFIIPVGYLSKQVIDFCQLAYNDYNIEFVEIDDYTSEKSGPGYTVSKILDKIDSPFWYIPCDTYFNENLLIDTYSEDIVFTKVVDNQLSDQYTMFKLTDDSRVENILFKKQSPSNFVALTGVMYIHDYNEFKDRLTRSSSPEIIFTIKLNTKTLPLDSWLDFGNLKIYSDAVSLSQKYDFTKTDEYTFFVNNRVLKWYKDNSVPFKKYHKTTFNEPVFPKNCKHQGEWLAYDYFNGDVIYKKYNLLILRDLLNWLDNAVWKHSNENISTQSNKFYMTKTLERIKKFLIKYPNASNPTIIDNVKVKPYFYYLENINWDMLVNENLPGFIHGDLHFDNTVMNNSNEFKIIDWRHEFGDLVNIGDIYYDLAKLTGGFILDYQKIKNNEFGFNEQDGIVTLTIPSIIDSHLYINEVKNFVLKKGWNYNKVKLLVPIIYWNMAPLHTAPFDKFLWYLGLKLFEECI